MADEFVHMLVFGADSRLYVVSWPAAVLGSQRPETIIPSLTPVDFPREVIQGLATETAVGNASNASVAQILQALLAYLQASPRRDTAQTNQTTGRPDSTTLASDSRPMTGQATASTMASAPATFGRAEPARDERVAAHDAQRSRSVLLSLNADEGALSDYQCFIRKQIELFETTEEDLVGSAQGRNRPVTVGQVGIRCRHCAPYPKSQRGAGSVFYPTKLEGIYQTAQNMALSHLASKCRHIPSNIREEMDSHRRHGSGSLFGSRQHWMHGARALGIVETEENGLRFQSTI